MCTDWVVPVYFVKSVPSFATHSHLSEIEVFFFSCATFLYQKSHDFKNFVDDPYMLLGNMYKTFTKSFTISNGEESLLLYTLTAHFVSHVRLLLQVPFSAMTFSLHFVPVLKME